MIRFACPGCNAVYTVEDSKGGKAGKCPKCAAQFVIPASDAAAPLPPPPAPRRAPPPPPPPAPASDAPVEIKPCPKCGARLSVAAGDLGIDVECPYCQKVYTARRSDAPEPAAERPSRRREEPPPAEDRPSSRRPRDDDEDDRPRRRPAAEVEDDADDRPRRRRRDEDDEEEDDRPRRKKKRRGRSPEVDTVARLNYILGGLGLLCGCGLMASGGLAGAAAGAAAKQPGAKALPVDPAVVGTLLLVVGGVQILFSVLMIVAGMGVSKRQNWGRVMTLGTGGMGCLFGLLYLANVVMSLVGGNIPGAVGGLIGTGIWGGYGFKALTTMLNHGDEFE